MKKTAIVVIAMVSSGAVWAHTGATGVVKERMESMSSMADAMKIIVPMTRGETAFDPVAYAEAARQIASESGQSLVAKFPEGSLLSPSEASPAVWEEMAGFTELAMELEARATQLADAALNADRPPEAAFGAMARTCGSCHQGFRIETD